MKRIVHVILICMCFVMLTGCDMNSIIADKVTQTQQEKELQAQQEKEAKSKLSAAEQDEFNARYRKEQIEQEIEDAGFISNALSHAPLLGRLTKAGKAKQKLKEVDQEIVEAEAASDEARTNYAAVTGTSTDVNQQAFSQKNMLWIIVGVAGFILLILIIFLMSRSRRAPMPTPAPVVIPAAPSAAPTSAVSGNYNRNKALEKWCVKAGISPQEALSAAGGDQEAAVQYAMDRASGLR